MNRLRASIELMAGAPRRWKGIRFSNQLSTLSIEWEKETDVGPIDPDAFKRLVDDAKRRFARGETIESSKTIKQLALALWDDEFRLGRNSAFVNGYLRSLEKCRSNGALKALARQYLFYWPNEERRSGAVGDYLRKNINRVTSGWARNAAESGLFEDDRSVRMLAHKAADPALELINELEAAGLRGGALAGAYAEAIFKEACNLVRSSPGRSRYERLTEFFISQEENAQSFRFSTSDAKNAYAGALLGPWANINPDESLRRWITSKILEIFDDPRISAGRWQGVDVEHIITFKRWLAQQSLEQFLDIVGRSISDFDKKRMWKYRRPFWTSYFEADLIQEAWVLFGKEGAQIAAELTKRDPSLRGSYGSLDSSDRTHSVLLMKIGDITIAEWSHNGKCWIWSRSRGAPKLYQREMTDEACRHAPFGQVHGGSVTFRWQQAVAEELKRLGVPKTAFSSWKP